MAAADDLTPAERSGLARIHGVSLEALHKRWLYWRGVLGSAGSRTELLKARKKVAQLDRVIRICEAMQAQAREHQPTETA